MQGVTFGLRDGVAGGKKRRLTASATEPHGHGHLRANLTKMTGSPVDRICHPFRLRVVPRPPRFRLRLFRRRPLVGWSPLV